MISLINHRQPRSRCFLLFFFLSLAAIFFITFIRPVVSIVFNFSLFRRCLFCSSKNKMIDVHLNGASESFYFVPCFIERKRSYWNNIIILFSYIDNFLKIISYFLENTNVSKRKLTTFKTLIASGYLLFEKREKWKENMCSESYTFKLIPQEELGWTFKTSTNGKRRRPSTLHQREIFFFPCIFIHKSSLLSRQSEICLWITNE